MGIQPADRQRQRPQPEPVELAVVYEDDWLVALDKPAGLVVHPTYKNTSGTLLNGVLWRYRDRPAVQPGILTRLDKGTSGLVVIALRAELHARMQRDATAGRTRKEYLAVVARAPDPPSGTIALPLMRDREDRRRVVVDAAGQASHTEYAIESGFRRAEHVVALRCVPVTGRTHQIRVHLAAIGCPVIGDAAYGEPSARIGRQALHAWRVALPHPATHERLLLEAPVPADMLALLT